MTSRRVTVDRRCVVLAELFLASYRLSPAERREEVDRLAQAIQQTIETELEARGHRKV